MGSRVQSTVGCFPEFCFLQFSMEQVLVGLRKQFMNNFVYPTYFCAAGFNNNNIIICRFPLQNLGIWHINHKEINAVTIQI